MAEGLINMLYGDRYKAFSADTNPLWVHPYAVLVMEETGIDISRDMAYGKVW
jgi:arsenate reductase